MQEDDTHSELTTEQITKLLAGQVNEKIEEMEAIMLTQDQVEIPPTNRFVNGMYAREIMIPKGTMLTGRVHKYGYVDIMLSGDISVATPDGVKRLTGINIMEGLPGRKRAGIAHEDTRWITVHRTDVESGCQFVDELTLVSMAEYNDFRVKEDRNSFLTLLHGIGLEDKDIQHQVQNKDDMTNLPAIFDDLVTVSESKIHGFGLFAELGFERGEHIAPARISGMRTIAGRYTNHSALPNAKMEYNELGDIDLIAIRKISQGEEITTDYSETIQSIQRGEICQQYWRQ